MTTRVTVSTTPDGQLVVVKQSLKGDRGDRQAEAAWLMAAETRGEASGRPIVVPLVDFEPEGGPTITTAHRGSTTLRTAKVAPVEAARLLTHVCEGLAVLHDDDLVHGKLSLDHLIVSSHPDEHGPVLICSPDGHATDVAADYLGLARCVRALIEQWSTHSSPAWANLARRLETPEVGFSMRRAARAFEELGDDSRATRPSDSETVRSDSRVPVRGLSIAAALAVVAIIGVSVLDRRALDASANDGAVVDVDGSRYMVGSSGDVAIGRPDGCLDGPAVVMLARADHSVWTFATPDQTEAIAVAVVPGATNLEHRGDTPCPELWATGPAGAILLDLAQK